MQKSPFRNSPASRRYKERKSKYVIKWKEKEGEKKRIKSNISEETNNSSLKSPNSTKDINHFVVKPINREESE